MRIPIFATILICAMIMNLHAFDGDAWIVVGDDVRVRSNPSIKGTVVTSLKAGTVVRVTEKTDNRDKFLQGDEFGFYWYNAVLPGGKKGWIYGKFLYQMNGDRFADDPAIFANPLKIGGKLYYFGIAVEDAYPAADDNGLTGSTIHAVPFMIQDNGKEGLLFKSDSVRTFHDENLSFPYFFRMTDDEGGMQTVKSVTTTVKGKIMHVKVLFDYSLQDGGGTFYILAKPDSGALIITEYQPHPVN